VHTNLEEWTREYQNHAKLHPWFFVVQSEEYKAGEGVRVLAYPDVQEWIRLGTLVEPVNEDDIYIPLAVVDEILTKKNAAELTAALKVIQQTQALSFNEGLLMIIHVLFWLADWDHHRMGETSLFSGRRFRDFPDELRRDDSKLMSIILDHTLTTIHKLLLLWRKKQGHLIRGFLRPKEEKPGLPSYKYFPPHWLSLEDLRQLDGPDSMPPKVPVLIDADLAPFLPNMVQVIKLQGSYRQPMQPTLDAKDRPIGQRFKKDGQRWSVVYDSKHISLNHSDGATYIAYLLEHPDEPFHARVLYEIAHPPSRDLEVARYSDLRAEERMDPLLDDERSPTDKLDDCELYKTYIEGIRDTQSKLDQALNRKDFHEAEELQAQVNKLKGVFSAEFGLDRQLRKKDDPNKQAYDKVSKAINAVRKVIKEHHPALATHLKNSLHYDTYTYCYSPDCPITWET